MYETAFSLSVNKVQQSRIGILENQTLEFGKVPSDHMLVAVYKDGNWQEAAIMPYQNLSLAPLTAGFHYGQTIFEGQKAFRRDDGNITIFRLEKHFERFNKSARRMSMPEVPRELFVDGLRQLISVDQDWVIGDPGCSLYVRPFMIASEPCLGVRPSSEYLFMIVTCPVANYFDRPLRLKVETQFVRAVEGGAGAAKCGGNYGAVLLPTEIAKEEGFDQVIWTDGKTNEWIEEAGVMNVMFRIGDSLVTPPVGSTVLEGITRDSIITLARNAGISVEERRIKVDELLSAYDDGLLTEACGIGTAAVIAPIESIRIGERDLTFNVEDMLVDDLKSQLTDIRAGRAEDVHGWNDIIFAG